MKKNPLVFIIGMTAVFALIMTAFKKTNQFSVPRTIAVSGECLTTAPRDKTAITLRVSALSKNATESIRNASNQMAEITKYLKTLPVEMQTTQFNSYEKTEWNRNEQKSVVLGIETNISVEISANNTETIEQILGRFSEKDDIYSENLRMYTSPQVLNQIIENCLGTAVENARNRAKALAQGDNVQVGKILSLSYNTNAQEVLNPTNGLLRTKIASADSVASASGTIVSRNSDVSVSVSATFEIKD